MLMSTGRCILRAISPAPMMPTEIGFMRNEA
jgi:hypothetical protein